MKIVIDYNPETRHSNIATESQVHPAVLACILHAVRESVVSGVVASLGKESDIAIAHAMPKFNGELRIAGNGHGD